MSSSPVLLSTQARILTISLNRPEKCNALDGELIEALRNAFYTAANDEQVQAVLLKGAGKHFCAGADLAWMRQLAQGSFEFSRDDARNLASLLYTMYIFPKPILTLAQGSVMGGGLGLLACSDVVIASSEASFCFSEVKIGLVPAVISPYIVSIMGERAARYYFLTAEKFTAQEAQRLGLVQKMVPESELENAGLAQLQAILKNGPLALTEVKKLLPMISQEEISLELSEKTAEIFAHLRVSDEAQEGLKAFFEKRPPAWENKE